MQLTTLFTVAFATLSLAAPIGEVSNDLPSITAALTSVGARITEFDTSLQTLASATDLKTTLTTLAAKGEAITAALKDTVAKVKATPSLTLEEATKLALASYDTAKISSSTVKKLQAEKAVFAKANALPAIHKQLEDQKAAMLDLIKETGSKVPDGVKQYYNEGAQLASVALEKGIAAFA
jgi:hypothetical protein